MRIENKMYRSLGRLNKLPASWREAVQTRLMGRFVPLLGTAGLRFEHISREQVRVSVRNRRAVQNHIGGVHACAMALLAETATGFATQMNTPDEKSAILSMSAKKDRPKILKCQKHLKWLNAMEVYHSHPLASQVIFADTGYNTTTERSTGQKDDKGKTIRERVKVFSPIKDIVERLVQSGIPREQIAIVDGSVKAEARKAIADKVNTGEIRVVIGLTQTLGVGVNMQRNLRAMHHLDAPWMPGES